MTPATDVLTSSESELETCQRLGLKLFYWIRQGDPKTDWKKAIGKQWNRSDLADDFSRYDPAKHNVGTITGTELPGGHFLADVDIDWVPPLELTKLLPASDCVFGRPEKPVSHLFFATPERLPSVKEYKDIDGTKFMELFGGDHSQYTMVPPSMRKPDEPLAFTHRKAITPIAVEELERRLRNYAIAVVLYKNIGTRNLLHDLRLPLAGWLLKEGLSFEDVDAIGSAIRARPG
jgi:hypothetical protein